MKQNPRLTFLVNSWRESGSPEQEEFTWKKSRPKWVELARDFNVDIESFPDMIGREFLWRLSSNSKSVESIFLAVMIWGYGDIGYGSHRVRQMFESEEFSKTIARVKELCEINETLEAYKTLRDSRIRQLGPSFGSKILTFFHPRNTAPPILDSIVAKWVNLNAPHAFGSKPLNSETWNVATFSDYAAWVSEVGSQFRIPSCTVEQLIFADGYSL